MPAIVAIAIRYLIMAAVQLGLWGLLEKYAIPLLNKAIVATMQAFGVSEETAKDIMANKLIEGAEEVGVFAATLKTKLPIKVAEMLGFASKGFVKRVLPTSVATIISGKIAVPSTLLGGAKKMFLFAEKRLNTIFLGFLAGAGLMDFANWETGAYSDTWQKIFSVVSFGLLKPDEDYRTTKTTSPEIFSKVYNSYKLEGATEIADPYKNERVPFTRDNLLDLIDKVGAHLIATRGNASTKDVIFATQLMIIFGAKPTTSATQATATGTTTTSSVKVFTGVVTQGTLGAAVAFSSRENDLINDTAELKDAAQNNLASFVATLPGKLSYEIKIQNSVVTKDGTRRTGTAQQVRTGTSASGAPKYKTVLNKFAVMDVFVFTDRNVRTKITQIILGPTDSVTLQPKVNELNDLATALPKSVFTTDINDISGVQTSKPITVAPPPVSPPVSVPTATATTPATQQMRILDDSYFIMRDGTPFPIWRELKDKVLVLGDPRDILTEKETEGLVGYGNFLEKGRLKLLSLGIDTNTIKREPFPIDRYSKYGPVKQVGLDELFGAPPTPTQAPTTTTKVAVAEITTLSQWYASRGEALPSIQARGQFYENLGLGLAGYYTGTAEQNTKLLNALKAQNFA